MSRTGEVASSSIVPSAFPREQAHRDHGDKKQSDHVHVGQERPYDLLIYVLGNGSPSI